MVISPKIRSLVNRFRPKGKGQLRNLGEIKIRLRSIDKVPKIAVASAEDEDVLEAIAEVCSQNIAEAILVGDEESITAIMKSINFKSDKVKIINAESHEEASKVAVSLVKDGTCDLLMKGLTPTSTLLKAALDREVGIRGTGILSHIGLFESNAYHKLIAAADCAVNISPKKEILEQIITNSINALKTLEYDVVKTCLIAASEKPNEKIPESIMLNEISNTLKVDKGIIEGPYAIDNAVNAESCEIKGIEGEAAGDADLLIFPNLIAGNVFYKSMTFLGQAKVAGCIIGAEKPIVLTSRSDSSESKFNSICLAIYLATREGNDE